MYTLDVLSKTPTSNPPSMLHIFEFFSHCDIEEFMIRQRKLGERIWKEYHVGQKNKTPCEWCDKQWVLHVRVGFWRRPDLTGSSVWCAGWTAPRLVREHVIHILHLSVWLDLLPSLSGTVHFSAAVSACSSPICNTLLLGHMEAPPAHTLKRGQDQDWIDHQFILHKAGLGSRTLPCPYIVSYTLFCWGTQGLDAADHSSLEIKALMALCGAARRPGTVAGDCAGGAAEISIASLKSFRMLAMGPVSDLRKVSFSLSLPR